MQKRPVPKLFFKVVCLLAVVFAGQTQAGDSGSPVPVPRAGKPGPPMLLGTSVMSDQNNLLVKSLGFSHAQTDSDHLTVNEPEPGRWDWTSADAGLAAMQKAGMKWQYFPHFHWPPEWYRQERQVRAVHRAALETAARGDVALES